MNKNKLYSILLSVVVAFGLWLYVVGNISVEDENTFYNIPVVTAGETVLSERNLMVTNMSAKNVSVTLYGTREDLNKLDSSNITVKLDLSNINEPGESIALTPTISTPPDLGNVFTVEQKNPEKIYVDVDYRRTFEIPVVVKWTGTRSENYIYDTENYQLDYPNITISGPAAVADQIDHAEIEIDLSERVESISEGFRYTLCDIDGNPVDAVQITTNVEEVRLDAQIQRIKDMKLAVDVIYGGGATQENTVIRLSHETIRVSGGEAVLKELGDTLTVCTVNLADIEKSTKDLIYPITLPEGVTNQTGATELAVSVLYSGLKTREFTIDHFEMVNIPERMEAEIINTNLAIKVRGPEDEIAKLSEKDITAVVDFSAAEVGTATYKATITFSDKFPGVGALKTNSVSATVRAVEE